jgi:aspartyl protease family protein
MKDTFFWVAVWAGILAAGYFVAERLTAPPPVARVLAGGLGEIVIPASRNGHYYVEGAVNGVPLVFMIDTGATYVSVDAQFARRAGLPEGIPGYFNTANGAVEGRVVKNQTVKADAFEVSGLSVAVMPARGADGLLGQNFLRRFEVSQAGGTMRLRPRADAKREP